MDHPWGRIVQGAGATRTTSRRSRPRRRRERAAARARGVAATRSKTPVRRYCHKRTTKGARNSPSHLSAAARAASAARNNLDEIFYDAAKEVHAWKRCCYGVDEVALAEFRRANFLHQNATGCHASHDRMQRGVDAATVGNPDWAARHDPVEGQKCARLDPRKYALPSGDSDHWRPDADRRSSS